MTTTLTRPPGVRYFRRFAARTARWTLVVTTAFTGGQYLALVFGLTGLPGALVGAVPAVALGITAAAATEGHRWAVVLTSLVWAGWLVAGHVRHGWANLSALAVLVAGVALIVGVVLAGGDHRRNVEAGR